MRNGQGGAGSPSFSSPCLLEDQREESVTTVVVFPGQSWFGGMGPGNGAGFPVWVMMEVLGSLGWVPPVGAPGAEGVGEAGGTHGTLPMPITVSLGPSSALFRGRCCHIKLVELFRVSNQPLAWGVGAFRNNKAPALRWDLSLVGPS